MGAQWESYLAKAGPMGVQGLVAKGRADPLHSPLAQSSTGPTETSILILRIADDGNLPSLPPRPLEHYHIR